MHETYLALLTGLLASGLRLSMVIGFSTIGEAVSERSGIVNVGLEGIMLVGAFLLPIARWPPDRRGAALRLP